MSRDLESENQMLRVERDGTRAALLALVTATPAIWREAHRMAQFVLGIFPQREPPTPPGAFDVK